MMIAIIDDDQYLLKCLEILLGQAGHKVQPFHSAGAALDWFDCRPSVDVLVVDYQLKSTTAVELLESLKAGLPPGCKVILVSGHTDIVGKLDLGEMRVDAFLPKPLDLGELLEQICSRTGVCESGGCLKTDDLAS